ncbi:MAG TPA: flagellar basal-body MS-ring/collar protein FliF [Candidatus Acidoferrum sp.]|nr:flagellar basal-body MS-ring/collar protein FliF [Candidatus Acidoferrum sp.]
MERIFQQISAFLRGLTLRQRVLLVGSLAVVGAIVWVFSALLAGGEYKPLYSGMAPADAQTLAQRLGAANIAYQLSTDGTSVLVRADQMDKARLEVATEGPLPSGRMGFELFDKPNWSGSDFSEKVNYQRALEGELERTIQTMNGVEAVRVHLVLPHESLFNDRERPAKAAVVLKLRGTRLTEQIATSVANLVSSAWDDLSPQNVTVVTTDGQMPWAGHGNSGPGRMTDTDLETQLAEKVVQTLAPVVGSDHVKSSVTIDYDATSGDTTQETYDPNTTAVLTSQISQETVGDLQPSGIPGTPSNTPNTQGSSTAAQVAQTSSASQGIHTESKTFAVSRTTHHIVEPAGRIKRIAAAILVDDATETKTENGKTVETHRKRTPDEMAQIESLAKAAIGFDAQRGDEFSLQDIPFTQTPLEIPQAPGKVQRFFLFAQKWTGLLRYAGLLLLFAIVYLLILKPVKKQVMRILETPIKGELAVAGGAHPEAAALAAAGHVQAGTLEAFAGGSPELRQAVALKKELAAKVKEDPESASRLIQNWMRETEKQS